MTCSICKSKTHNKRTCPNKDTTTSAPPQPPLKRCKSTVASSRGPQIDNLTPTAEPSRTGKNGRVIKRGGSGVGRGGSGVGRGGSGVGRGGSSVGRGGSGVGRGGRRAGRGGRGKNMPKGVGVLIGEDGSTMINAPGQIGGPRLVSQPSVTTTSGCPLGSQASTSHS
ncbi:rRNA 2'-O-methyltransferase fibrillarin-like [Beta vulgaris subsp. vulgaris]|uniref:rRNA 2'-O-methyltransferase fibrillarin-like n=1 Tax=Beta vulgaris subsp. vulgaris TaxID=3555 RepID=UPI0025477098|nr:rRNA 2'-O-methyltransferase fibrillarin-like [Beta vulgaris subsp. vulgaris]